MPLNNKIYKNDSNKELESSLYQILKFCRGFLNKRVRCKTTSHKSHINQSRYSILKQKKMSCELDYHDRKIRRKLTHDIQKHSTADSTLLSLISSVYRDLPHWRSNQRPQITEPKLYKWTNSPHHTQVTPN